MFRRLVLVIVAGVCCSGLILAQALGPVSAAPDVVRPATMAGEKGEIPATLYAITVSVGHGDPLASVSRFYPETKFELYIPSVGLALLRDGRVEQRKPERYADARDRRHAGEPFHGGPVGEGVYQVKEEGVERLADLTLSAREVEAVRQAFHIQEELGALARLTGAIANADRIVTAKLQAMTRSLEPGTQKESQRDWELKFETKRLLVGKATEKEFTVVVWGGRDDLKVGESYVLFLQTRAELPPNVSDMVPATEEQVAVVARLIGEGTAPKSAGTNPAATKPVP